MEQLEISPCLGSFPTQSSLVHLPPRLQETLRPPDQLLGEQEELKVRAQQGCRWRR